MRLSQVAVISVAMALAIGPSCYVDRVPDLTLSRASGIITQAPEFNRYARLVRVERLDHAKDSMDFVTFGKFTFQYLNAPHDTPPIRADVDFRYHEGKWYLNQFDYGCPHDCHFVYVFDGPDKRK